MVKRQILHGRCVFLPLVCVVTIFWVMNMPNTQTGEKHSRADFTKPADYVQDTPSVQVDVKQAQEPSWIPPEFLVRGTGLQALLNVSAPSYMQDYKNPCWIEPMDSSLSYRNNPFLGPSGSYFKRTKEILEKDLKEGMRTRVRCLPYFYVAGVSKCGTTDLQYSLRLHPEIAHAGLKEPLFWSHHRRIYARIAIADYIDLFDGAAHEIGTHVVKKDGKAFHPMIVGDASSNTLHEFGNWQLWPENDEAADEPKVITPHYIRKLTPDARIVITLRNPVDRLYSHYYRRVEEDMTSPEDFHQRAIESMDQWNECVASKSAWVCLNDKSLEQRFKVTLKDSMYSFSIKKWLEIFPRNQIHIHRLEHHSKDKVNSLNKVFTFLGLYPLPAEVVEKVQNANIRNSAANRTTMKYKGPMLNETRKLLDEFFRPCNEELVEITGDDAYNFK